MRKRNFFGKAIWDSQNIKFKLAEVATLIKVGRAFTDRCVEDLVADKLDIATASRAKLWACEAQGRVIDECLQLLGGYGYTNEYMVARMYTDARVQRIYGGTNEIMKEVIARSLQGEPRCATRHPQGLVLSGISPNSTRLSKTSARTGKTRNG